jgi:hypothetical protein
MIFLSIVLNFFPAFFPKRPTATRWFPLAGARGVCGYALGRAASGFDSNTLPFDGRLIVGEAAGIDRKGQFNEIDRFAK